MPALISWPERIPPGQVLDDVGAAFDIFPTLLNAAGGDPSRYELDGLDILRMVAEGAASPHAEIFWEMAGQTAVRRGNWKLVLNGRLEEGAPPEDDVHLADLEADMGERTNLKDEHPDVAAELNSAAEAWRADTDEHWDTRWKDASTRHTGHPVKRQ
jgi:arylsulfatase A-like enzyme